MCGCVCEGGHRKTFRLWACACRCVCLCVSDWRKGKSQAAKKKKKLRERGKSHIGLYLQISCQKEPFKDKCASLSRAETGEVSV